MNIRTIFKNLLVLIILAGVAWLWWRATAPDLPEKSSAPTHRAAKPVVASLNFKIPPIQQSVMATPAPKSKDSATPTAIESSETDARTAKARTHLKEVLAFMETNASRDPKNVLPSFYVSLRNVNYALAHQDSSLPDSAYVTLPLNQAEHHTFNQFNGSTQEASIEGYYYDNGGREWVEFYTWQQTLPSGGIVPEGPSEGRQLITVFSPADQDYIRNWAKQQAAAAAAAQAAAPPAESAPEAPAPEASPQPSGPLVITN